MAAHYTISEFQSFTRGPVSFGAGYRAMEHEDTFDQLKEFVLENRAAAGTEALELMTLSAKRGIGEVISAKNYVGLIAMNNGDTIEILPKVYGADETKAKRLLLQMLKTVRNMPFKTFDMSRFDTSRLPILEVFIRMFIQEALLLVKRGLKSDYRTQRDNSPFFKGKLLVSEQIKYNLIHQERSFAEYDEFTADCSENRLIRTALGYLNRKSADEKNRKDLRVLLSMFDCVRESDHVYEDFARCRSGRDMAAYQNILQWCRVFLQGRSFTSYAGKETAFALLYPMEKLFESYVAEIVKQTIDCNQYSVRIQERQYWLFDRKFALRPDIVVEERQSGQIWILDTKWKLLSPEYPNYGISQADMYQMYAYGKKYHSSDIFLIYPLNEKVLDMEQKIEFLSGDGVTVRVVFADLMSRNNC